MLLIDNGWTFNTWAVRPLLVSSLLLIGWRLVLKGGTGVIVIPGSFVAKQPDFFML